MVIYKDNDKSNCTGCRACSNICPRNAISFSNDEYGFAYPIVDKKICVQCGLCTTACKKTNKNEWKLPLKTFAATHKNKEILKSSSSGGVFSALAEHFLDTDGIVCGCIFDDNLNAVHICTEKKDDLYKIRKSKYLQSNVGFIYRDIKKYLENGRKVLFTGTPCQVAALYAVLGKEYKNLLTMDLICHGVPSQFLFDKFIEYLEKQYKTKIVDLNFRSKKYGWQRFTMEFTTADGKTKNIGKSNEFYFPAFSSGFSMRPSCFSCKYACPERIGDFTIGDFWGYEKLDLVCDTTNGTSVFTANTQKALSFLDVLFGKLIYEEIDYKIAVNGNTCLRHPTVKGEKYDKYMQALKDNKIEELALRYKQNNKKFILRGKLRLIIPLSVFKYIKKNFK